MRSGWLVFRLLFVWASFLCVHHVKAQQAKNGPLSVVATGVIVNEYTVLSVDALVGSGTLTVASSILNANGRFSGALSAGDLIMIIQMQGVTIETYQDASWGSVLDYNNCGNHEFAEVALIPDGTSIEITCPLRYDYTTAGKVQVVRVPRYASLSVSGTGGLTAEAWNGSTGGVLAVEVAGNTTISAGGVLEASILGFRGGYDVTPTSSTFNDAPHYALPNGWDGQVDGYYGAVKGEGVAGYDAELNVLNGRFCRAAAANGGGGGNAHNCGGGGGANAGIGTYNSYGNPDRGTGNAYDAAWNLDDMLNATSTSSGGGRGGYSSSDQNQNALATGVNAAGWGADKRKDHGGLGGRVLDYSTGRLFLGGGGGSGEGDNNRNGDGGRGGGLIYVLSYGNIQGSGEIKANGQDGEHAPVNAFTGADGDGAGGGGAGGTVVLNATGTISGVSVLADGGKGGDQQKSTYGASNQAEGPGGGGGGGYVAVSGGAITRSASGGANGITNSPALTEFPPNGATRGGAGIADAVIGNTVAQVALTAMNDTICVGDTALLVAALSGYIPAGYTIGWYDAEVGGSLLDIGDSLTRTGLTADSTYYVAVCPGIMRKRVDVIVTPFVFDAGTAPNICAGDSIQLAATGGVFYNWSPGSSLSRADIENPYAKPVSSTTYYVTVTSADGCSGVDSVSVTVGSIVPTVDQDTSVCEGGSVQINAGGGTNYTWSPVTGLSNATIADPIATPTATTTYSVVVDNGGMCAASDSLVVTVYALPDANLGPDSVICTGSAVELQAGLGAFFMWNSGETTDSISISPLITTTYSVTAFSVDGCSDRDEAVITVNNLPVLDAGEHDTICMLEMATLTAVSDGSFLWSDGSTSASMNAVPLVTTTYTVTSVLNGCMAVDAAIVVVNLLPTADAGADISVCTGGSAVLRAAGGDQYNWNTGATTDTVEVSPLTTSTYTVTVTAQNGCSDAEEVVVSIGSSLPVDAGNDTLVCKGASTVLEASGGVTYAWNTGTTGAQMAVSPDVVTTYRVTATAGSGCSGSDQVVVGVLLAPATPVVAVGDTICAGGVAALQAFFGDAYAWNTGESDAGIAVSPAFSTVYTVSASHSYGCTSMDTAMVVVVPVPLADAGSDTSVCEGDLVVLHAAGGLTYLWDDATTADSLLVAPVVNTSYTVTVFSGDCADTDEVVVVVRSRPAADAGENDSICQGFSAVLMAAGGSGYSWSDGGQTTASITVMPDQSALYTVTVTEKGCTAQDEVLVHVSPDLVINTGGDETICLGEDVLILVAGGTDYNWSNGLTTDAFVDTPQVSTTYLVTATGSAGCTGTDQIVVTVLPVPVADAGKDDTVCVNTAVTLTATGGSSYSWSTGETGQVLDVIVGAVNQYTVTVTNGLCDDVDIVQVFAWPNPLPDAGLDTALCAGSGYALSASGGVGYLWSTGLGDAATIDIWPATSAVYTVTVTDVNGCTGSDSVAVAVNAVPADATINDAAICINETTGATLAVQGALSDHSYYWYDQAVGGIPVHAGSSYKLSGISAEETFYVEAVTGGNCVSAGRTPASILLKTLPVADFTADKTALFVKDKIAFENQSVNHTSSYWSFGYQSEHSDVENPDYHYQAIGMFTVTLMVTSTDGCMDIMEKEDYVTVSKRLEVFVPDVFTPNGDNKNEFLMVYGAVETMEMQVYNQWGFPVYSSTRQQEGWDGRYEGKPQPEGNYAYTLNYTLADGSSYFKAGVFALIR